MKKEFTLQQLPEIAKALIAATPSKKICFYGAMGVGKTTLIKALVKELGSTEEVSSPTFGIVNEYHTTTGEVLGYHFDFYRLQDESEALDFGIEDYFYSDKWIFMEWPEKIKALLPEDSVAIFLRILDSKTRLITLL